MVYVLQSTSIGLLAQTRKRTRKQVQPEIGIEKAFGLALREIRKEKGVSQEKLALEAGCDRTYVSLVERGLNSPTIRTVVKIARILGVPASEVVARMENVLSPQTEGL